MSNSIRGPPPPYESNNYSNPAIVYTSVPYAMIPSISTVPQQLPPVIIVEERPLWDPIDCFLCALCSACFGMCLCGRC